METRPQETLEFKLNKQMQTFAVSASRNLVEEGKRLLGVSLCECINSVFNITNENISFSITIPGPWQSDSDEKTFDELNKLLELRSLELQLKEVRKRGNKIKLGDNECKISDTQKTRYLKN